MRVYLEWWHFCQRTRRIRRLCYATCCSCGAWPYVFGACES